MSKTAVQSLLEKIKAFQDTLSPDEQRAFASMVDTTKTDETLSADQLANVGGGVARGAAMHEYRSSEAGRSAAMHEYRVKL